MSLADDVDGRRPYSKEQVLSVERSAERLGYALHDPYAPLHENWRRMDPEVLNRLFYDAMIALYEAMLDEEDD